ncbi:hypothetical protein EG68_07383 [Paragonimus skrjabini miyazakii]|uniref:UBX domain-containing protein n=1 Tax=Paragonimus skrjabini miyazakii TaxID=59628 RepID=A0A8S9YB21_9TREM|nr:hypothetical protein EG68_07383 [Paragonimus skrjabini miyazakii]
MPSIIVQYPSGHKMSVDIAANKPLIKALETACLQRSLDPSKHSFVYKRRPVDLSATFRFSGLVNNACVDLVPNENDSGTQDESTEIRVCFRLDMGQRFVWIGCSHSSLWSILNDLATAHPEIAKFIGSPDDSSSRDLPSVVYLQEQVIGAENLRTTTPADLGILRGSALLQLHRLSPGLSVTSSNSVTNNPDVQPIAMVSTPPSHHYPPSLTIDQPMSVCDEQNEPIQIHLNPLPSIDTASENQFVSPFSVFAERPSQSAFGQPEQPPNYQHRASEQPKTLGALLGISLDRSSSSDYTVQPSRVVNPFVDFKFPSETVGMDLRTNDSDGDLFSNESKVNRESVAFRLVRTHSNSSSGGAHTSDDIPDEFFNHTEEDIRNILRAYRSEWTNGQPLQTAAMRKSARDQMYRKYPRAIIQFHWSDGVVVQACFDPRERVSALYQFVKEIIQFPEIEFQLYTTPPKFVLKDKTVNLIDANLVPMAKVYFSGKSTKADDALLPELLSSAIAENVTAARAVVTTWMQGLAAAQASSSSSKLPSDAASANVGSRQETAKPSSPIVPPKWLKLGK